MDFENISKGIDCNCIEGAIEDNESTFIRLIDNTPTPKERDFLSHWERYEKQNKLHELEGMSCDKACGLKGLSMNKLDGYEEAEVYKVYTNMFLFATEKERKKKIILKFKMGSSVGITKHTPNSEHDSHHDLYKCDKFDLNNIGAILLSKIDFPSSENAS